MCSFPGQQRKRPCRTRGERVPVSLRVKHTGPDITVDGQQMETTLAERLSLLKNLAIGEVF